MFEKWRRVGTSKRMGLGKKIFIGVVFGSICVVFVFLDVGGSGMGGLGYKGPAAQVGNVGISFKDYRQRLLVAESMLSEQSGGMSDERRQSMREGLGERTLEQMILEELLRQSAHRERLWVSSSSVREAIQQIPAFSKDGQFRRAQYERYLKLMRVRAGHFESQIRVGLVEQQMRSMFTGAFFEPKVLKKARKQLKGVGLRVKTLRVPEQLVWAEAPKNASVEALKEGEGTAAVAAKPSKEHSAAFLNLRALLKEGSASQVSGWAKEHKLQWQDMRELNLSAVYLPQPLSEANLRELLALYAKAKPVQEDDSGFEGVLLPRVLQKCWQAACAVAERVGGGGARRYGSGGCYWVFRGLWGGL